MPCKPVYEAVIDAARQAALADPRFAPIQPDELPNLTLEISLLSSIRPLSYASTADLLAQIEPLRHGVVLQFEDRTATFLPQVWEQMPDKITFLDHLAVKGGWDPAIWRDAHARVSVYEVECFQEPAVAS
jgi:AmmeMemoRadiSam system protein A